MATLTFTVLLSLVLIGSDTAFNIIASLGASAILSSYIISITCITYRKITGYKLPPTRFPLGRAGLPINIVALCFLWLAFVLVFFPAEPDPTLEAANWSVLIYGVVVIFALLAFVTRKRFTYVSCKYNASRSQTCMLTG
jgi:choline transport protein